jgi:hypothetical protein
MQQADFFKISFKYYYFLLDFNKLLYCSSFHAEYYTKIRHEDNSMFRIMFLAKTLHKTLYRKLINETCTLFDKRCQKFIPRILKSENILFPRTQNVYFSDLGASEWGWGINCSHPPPACHCNGTFKVTLW